MKNLSLPSTIFEFMDFISRLSELKRRIINYILKEGRCTKEEIKMEFPDEEIEKELEELWSNNIIFKYSFLNFEFYELNLRFKKFYYYEKFPSGPVIPLIYHYNLLSDSNRLSSLKIAIEKTVKKGDLVLDVGCGTGILSILCARRGAKVFSVEIDPIVAEAAEYFIKNSGFSKQIFLFQDDIRNIEFNTKFDVIICEMLDTALIAELQVPVMNVIVKKYKKENTKFIPLKALTYAELIYKDYCFEGFAFPLIHYEEYGARRSLDLFSTPFLYHIADFTQYNSPDVIAELKFVCIKDGTVNSIRLSTEIEMIEGLKVKGSSWFNPPLILPFKDTKVRRGDILIFEINYGLGKGFQSISYKLKEHLKGGF